ncbi:MAG: AAA family ATPase [Actinobacteria bacterium]|nr:AAA family ATPase [Actinomycetota bacterium]
MKSVSTGGAALTQDRLVRRRRLFERLDRDWPKPLTVVAAPAGFGKTTAVERWLEQRDEGVVWVALDEDDNDPILLWSRILAETRSGHGVGAEAAAALTGAISSPRRAIQLLAAELAAAGEPLVFVLDDLHLIDDPACLRSIELAAGLIAATAPLVLITRTEPALPLERLHGRGQLLRIGPRELAFDRDETGELLESYGIDPDREPLDAVFAATGGWPAAVYMAALWLRDAPDRTAAARELAQLEGELTDYLLSEVVGGLDPELRGFMLRTSPFARISGRFCDEVLERRGSAATIERLRAGNLLVRGDRRHPGWHRYHPLLRRVLSTQLEAEQPGAATALHRRAARWLLGNGMPEEAAEQARDGGDHELLAELLQELHLDLTRSGRSATLLRWAEALPPELLDARPDVTMAAASAAQIAGRPALEIRRLLARADLAGRRSGTGWSAENEVEWQMMTATNGEAGVAASVAAARAGVAAADGAPQLGHVSRGVLSMFLELAGERAAAAEVATAVVEDPEAAARPFAMLLARGTLALAELARGRPRLARGQVEAATALIERAGLEEGPISARIYSCEALICLAEGDPATAVRAAGRSLGEPFETAPLRAWTLLVEADARAGSGDFRAAGEALAHAGELLAASPDPGRVAALREEVATRVAASETDGAIRFEAVTPAELRVLRRLAAGMTRAEIAASLVVSVNTVKTHQRSLYRKLGSGERETAIARARSHGLLD